MSLTRPIAPARPRRNPRASGSGPGYPRSRAWSRIRSRSAGESWSGRLKAFETVIGETPTSSARRFKVIRRGSVIRSIVAVL